MSLIDLLQPRDDLLFTEMPLAGVVVAIVTNNQDSDELGRVKLRFPWLADDQESDWARIVTPMAGEGRGMFFLPEVEDEVLVAFEHSDIRRPIVLGGLWNGVDVPPETNSDGENNIRVIRSRSGQEIRIDDTDGSEKIEILDASEDHVNKIVIDTGESTITITADADVVINAANGKISMKCSEFEVTASSSASITSDDALDLEASGTLGINGSTVNIN